MIIDYFNCEAYKMFFRNAVKPPERCGYEARRDYGIYAESIDHVMNPGVGGGPIYTRYLAFRPTSIVTGTRTVTRKTGPFGLFRQQDTVDVDQLKVDYDSRARFSILGTLFNYNNHTSNIGIFEVVDHNDNHLGLLYDVVTGLPCIVKQPTTLEEIQVLLNADPRYIAYVDPAIVRAEEIVRDEKLGTIIARAAQCGLNRILESQASLGVLFTDAEREERRAFMEESVAALQKFQENYAEMSTGEYNLNNFGKGVEDTVQTHESNEPTELNLPDDPSVSSN